MEFTGKSTEHGSIATANDLYDLTILEEMDDNDYLLELLTILLSETPKGLKEMKDALQAGKADTVSKIAHNLKSSAGIIQAETLNALLADIETLGKKGTINNELRLLVEKATHQFNSIEKALKMHVKALN